MTSFVSRVILPFAMTMSVLSCAAPRELERTPVVEAPRRLLVKAHIDGSDFLIVRGNQVWWVHRDWDLPGLHGDISQATFLNGKPWWPEWEAGDVSRPATVADALPSSRQVQVTLTPIKARGTVVLAEAPSPANDYALTILFNDDEIFGADWYEVALDWQ